MKKQALSDCIKYAEEFIKRAKAYEATFHEDSDFSYDCTKSASVRRASMDLTRRLADLRQGRE